MQFAWPEDMEIHTQKCVLAFFGPTPSPHSTDPLFTPPFGRDVKELIFPFIFPVISAHDVALQAEEMTAMIHRIQPHYDIDKGCFRDATYNCHMYSGRACNKAFIGENAMIRYFQHCKGVATSPNNAQGKIGHARMTEVMTLDRFRDHRIPVRHAVFRDEGHCNMDLA